MSEMKPDIKIRLLVASWPDDAPRGAVSAFCKQHNVSRAWFYKVRAAAVDGTWAALELGSTKPKSHPRATPQGMIDLALTVRAELEGKGVDCGPLSVHAILRRKGLTPPSRATLARLFTRAGVVAAEPRKKPRSAFRRFVYPAPNCCWQMDATDRTLADGTVVAIFQLTDNHSRLSVASLAASGETSEAAMAVVATGIARHVVPLRLLTDNGAAAEPDPSGLQRPAGDHGHRLGGGSHNRPARQAHYAGQERARPPDPLPLP